MIGHVVLAAGLAVSPAVVVRPELSVMTWNVCAGTNASCFLYRRTAQEQAWTIGRHALKADVIFLQESCTGADAALEGLLEHRTGRAWTVRSWGLISQYGTPYSCHPDLMGRPRGTQSVTVAVADHAARFETHPLTSPPWSVKRAALCATITAIGVRACTSHLSVGLSYDDHQPGAPYRTKQIAELTAAATGRGHVPIFGGDLNVRPESHALVPTYGNYQECDARRRWTMRAKKLDYLFVPRGRVLGCRVDGRTQASDHQPLYLRAAL